MSSLRDTTNSTESVPPSIQPSSLDPYQTRVLEEKADLDAKLTRLLSFVSSEKFGAVSPEQRILLRLQADTMSLYSNILSARIQAFSTN